MMNANDNDIIAVLNQKIIEAQHNKANFENFLNTFNIQPDQDFKALTDDVYEAGRDDEAMSEFTESTLYDAKTLPVPPPNVIDTNEAWKSIWQRAIRKYRKELQRYYNEAKQALADIDAEAIIAHEPLYTAAELAKTQAERQLMAWVRAPAAVEPQQ